VNHVRETRKECAIDVILDSGTNTRGLSDPSPTRTIIAQACAFSECQCARTWASEPSLGSHIVFDVNVSEGAVG